MIYRWSYIYIYIQRHVELESSFLTFDISTDVLSPPVAVPSFMTPIQKLN